MSNTTYRMPEKKTAATAIFLLVGRWSPWIRGIGRKKMNTSSANAMKPDMTPVSVVPVVQTSRSTRVVDLELGSHRIKVGDIAQI